MRFCPRCGQGTEPHPPTVGEFIHEFIGHHLALEGKLWITLRDLLLRPGALTRAYFAGRKASYILPLRLYLTISLVLFLAIDLSVPRAINRDVVSVKHMKEPTTIQFGITHQNPSSDGIDFGVSVSSDGRTHCTLPAPVCERAITKLRGLLNLSPTAAEEFLGKLSHGWAYAMFALMPLFAVFTRVTFRRAKYVYAEHLVCSLHLHSAWFVLLLVSITSTTLSKISPLLIVAFTVLSFKRVFAETWFSTVVKSTFIALIYLPAILLAFMFVSFLALLM